MDQRANDEMLETLKLFGVKAKDRKACLQDLTGAFDNFRRRMRRSEETRRPIEAALRLKHSVEQQLIFTQDA